MTPVVVVADFDAWRGRATAQEKQGAVEAAIAVATSWVERAAGRRSLAKTGALTITLDGERAEGRRRTDLWLPPDFRPVWHLTPDLVTVSENGSALTIAAGYSSSADVLIRNANEDRPVMLYRLGGWYPDRQNVVATLKVGWDATPPDVDGNPPAVLPLPASIRQLVLEATLLTFNSADWMGHHNVSRAGAAVTLENELSPMAGQTLEDLRGMP